MASSMLAVAAAAAVTAPASPSTHASPNACKDDEALSSSLHSCANDPDFAVICAFFQKFSKELGIDLPNFKHLQEWMSNTDEVSDQLRDLHIKLLRKTRKTVHEKSWESALSKFCFTYSAQDAWEVERFGYKQSSLKVKLRILRALLESQFERNGKFRAKILTINADSLRSQPIGRDRLGHSYWLTQDEDCNLRIYQEHLDEEIWRVVARNRDELVNLIARLRGNEVVLPSSDIGLVDEDTSSSNSYTAKVKKPPPPEEQDDSQEEGSRVPNLRIKLNNIGNVLEVRDAGKGEEELAVEEDANLKRKRAKARSQQNINLDSPNTTQEEVKRSQQTWPFVGKSSEMSEDMNVLKKVRPSLLDVNRTKKPSKYEKAKSEDDEEELSVEEEDIDSVAAEEDENELKDIEEYDDDETEEIGEAIEDPPIVVSGEGAGMDCNLGNVSAMSMEEKEFFLKFFEATEFQTESELGNDNVIEEDVFYVIGEGQGKQCLVGNTKNEAASSGTPPPTEPKATFFFGEPGCLKLTPMKQMPKIELSTENTSEILEHDKMSSIRTDKGSSVGSVEERCKKEMQSKEAHFEEKNTPGTVYKEQERYQEKLEVTENLASNGNNVSYSANLKKMALGEVIKTENCVEEVKNDGELLLLKSETRDQQINKRTTGSKKKENEDESKIENDVLQVDGVNPIDVKSKDNVSDLLCVVSPTIENIESKEGSNANKITDNICEIQSDLAILSADKTSQTTAEVNAGEKIGEVGNTNYTQTNIQTVSNVSTLNRKRRLTDNSPVHQTTRQSTSESEVELHSENQEGDGKLKDKDDALDIGGKRLKMRPKITNTGLRKKVEAQKFAIEETTSSSGEDDARRRRKVSPPKKQMDKNTKVNMATDDCENQEKEMFKQTSKQRDEKQSKETLPENRNESITKKSATASTALSILGSVTVKHKPTLAEIIEKKLKKTAEKTSLPIFSEADAEAAQTAIFSSKKLPITKPLKKNLLTQIRPEESDEEPIPRKRTTSNTAVTATADGLHESQLADSTKKQDDSASLCADLEAKAQEWQRKRRSSEEKKEPDTFATEEKKGIKCEKIQVERQHERSSVVKEALKQPAVVSRRSGRRGGATVIYTELLQPKRTRGGARGVLKTDDIKMEELEQGTSDAATNTLKKMDPALDKKEVQQNIRDNSKFAVMEELKKKPNSEPIPQTPTTTIIANSTGDGPGRGRGGRKKREVDTTNIIDTIDAETPVRQSRRIAQQKIREEAERRKLEEIALRTMKQELKKKKKAEKQADPTVVELSEHSSTEESEVELKKKTKKKCPGKDGWSSGSEEQEEPEEDDEPPHYETDPGSPLFKSDHEFSPESDLEDETQVVPMKRARTARKEDAEDDENGDEEACQKCGKSDHPEWILLCDNCDKGYHCSCLSPVLFYIPEGDWFCPPCQQEQLIAALEQQLKKFDECVERKRLQEEEDKRLAAEAERVEQERLETEKKRKERKKQKRKDKRRGVKGQIEGKGESDTDESSSAESDEASGKCSESDSSEDEKLIKKSKIVDYGGGGKRRRGDRRSRRRAATRGVANRRRRRSNSESGNNSLSQSASSKNSSSSVTDSDDEPIYKLRKRRQINVSYRLNEYDDLINSALKKEMDELAGAGNLGRGKDITTIIEAEKEEKARQKQLEKTELEAGNSKEGKLNLVADDETAEQKGAIDSENEDESLRRKIKPKSAMKKKPRKLTTLDITSEEDDASDEDFKTSSFEEDEDDDTSLSVSTNSDTSLEVYRRRNKVGKKQRKAARRTARERRKDRKFVVDESDEEVMERPKLKKKREDDSDYTESETESDVSENLDDVDSADLCDDTTSDESDGAWYPSKRKKQHKSNMGIARKSPKLKKVQPKKTKRVEYSDDDVSESEEEDDDDDNCGGKGSGKQPRSQPLKTSNAGKGKGKGKSGVAKKKKKEQSGDESLSDSEDSTRRTRGRRYAYLEDFDDDSSDGGIKPGVKRPDTPPEEREKFIQKQEEIKRMLAAKNAEGAKLAATPRLTPLKSAGDKEKRSPVKTTDSLSTVPLSVIRQAKVLDADYLQRKGEPIADLENVDGVDEFDDADLPDDFPDDMDEDTIVRMVEEEEEFGVAAAARDLPAPDEVLRNPLKGKTKEIATPIGAAIVVTASIAPAVSEKSLLISPSLVALSQMPGATTSASGLQEPIRKRLPIPTIHPPLLRHQFQPHTSTISTAHMMQRHPNVPPTHLLQNALSAPLGQPLNRGSFTHQRLLLGLPTGHSLTPPHLTAARQPLSSSQPLPAVTTVAETTNESDTKPRGRRKKITPLRDPLQKQQAAAAATAAAHSDKLELASSTSSVIKSPPLSLSQTGEMYKSPSSGGTGVQLSVITRMPHLPTQPHSIAVSRPAGGVYSAAEVPRFYGPPQQISQSVSSVGPPRQQASVQRHRGSSQMTGLRSPHSTMRASYGLPPPLRGGAAPSNHSPLSPLSSTVTSGGRSSYGAGDHRGPPPLGTVYGAPPSARHPSTHLNPYRPTMYGNPNCTPRATLGANLRAAPLSSNAEYASGVRTYTPYGYYPPPPPLTTPHQSITTVSTTAQQTLSHMSPSKTSSSLHFAAAPSSVIVSAPMAAVTGTPESNTVVRSIVKSPSPDVTATTSSTTSSPMVSVAVVTTKNTVEQRKKLTTLEAYPVSNIKSPLAIAGESSGSHSSPGLQPDAADDSSSTPAASAAVATAACTEQEASEFSGLVSYFSSQHDDYNT